MIDALVGWVQHDRIVVPHDAIVTPGTSQKEQTQQDTQQFVSSQDDATTAALCELGYHGVVIGGFSATSKAKDVLKNGDSIISVNGQAAASVASLTSALSTLTPGTDATVVHQPRWCPANRDGAADRTGVGRARCCDGSDGRRHLRRTVLDRPRAG